MLMVSDKLPLIVLIPSFNQAEVTATPCKYYVTLSEIYMYTMLALNILQ